MKNYARRTNITPLVSIFFSFFPPLRVFFLFSILHRTIIHTRNRRTPLYRERIQQGKVQQSKYKFHS
jgi:hypothetical protein